MKYRLKHKLAWWLRRWANKLEPQVQAPIIPHVPTYRGKEYHLTPLRLSVPYYQHQGNQAALDYAYKVAADQLGKAAAMHTSIEDSYENDEVILQLLILSPVNG